MAKPYTLHLGADVEVRNKTGYHRVEDVKEGSFVIRPDGRTVLVPVGGKDALNVKVTKDLKLTDKMVQVDELKVERGYTPERDPFRKMAGSLGAAAAAAQDAAGAAVELAASQRSLSSQQSNAASNPGSAIGLGAAQSAVDNSMQNMVAAGNAMNSEVSNPGAHVARMGAELDEENYDAVEVSLRVSTPGLLTDPYVIVVAQFRERGARRGQADSWVYAAELAEIDATPRTVRFKQGGFPPGFELIKYEVHFYDQGREVASSAAERNVALSRAEAHEFLVVDYLTTHRGQTIPPSLALGATEEGWRVRFVPDQLQQTFYVKVGADGRPQGVFLNEACTKSVGDPLIDTLVSQALFCPALKEGKPAVGVAAITLADLAR